MNNLSYSSRQVFKAKTANFVKLISLVIGLFLGIMLFTALAYNFTFDNFYKDSDRIFVVYADYVNGQQHSRENFAFSPAPIASAALDEIKEIECASKFQGPDDKRARKEGSDAEYIVRTIYADVRFFEMFELELIAGDIRDYTLPGSIFISQSKANEIFATQDVIGRSLIFEQNQVYTVKGIIKDYPTNSSWRIDAVKYEKEDFFSNDWTENHWTSTFLKLSPRNSARKLQSKAGNISSPWKLRNEAAQVEQQLEQLQQRHYDVAGMKAKGKYVTLSLAPIEKHHNLQGSAMSANIIVMVLGIVLLVISGLNYVLLSISTMNSRAKEIGVHKCNGASKWAIFSLLLWETAIYIFIATTIALIMIFAFRGAFETLTSAPLSQIFRFENLYAVILTVIALFIISGAIPAKVFSSIPVTQVFKQQSNKRTPWKKALLFIQLFSTVFILTFLVVVIRQSNTLFTADHGVKTDNIVYTEISNISLEHAIMVRDQLSQVEGVLSATVSTALPIDYPGGESVQEAGSGNTMFTTGYICSDERFAQTYSVPVLYGKFLSSADDTVGVVVNEKFINMAGWEPAQALGKQFTYKGRLMTIEGIAKDFHLSSFKILEQFPLVLSGYGSAGKSIKISLNLSEMDAREIDLLNAKLKELLPSSQASFHPYFDAMFLEYEGEVTQKKIVGIAAIAILLVSLIGVISYVSVDVNRRRREIAIRRVHGATIGEVLRMISQGVSYYSFAAAIVGSICSVFMAQNWQKEFFIKIPLSPWIYIAISAVVIFAVAVTTILQSIKIVSANPAETIKAQ